MKKNLFSFEVKAKDGKVFPLSQYEGKVILVVNVASKCGFTPQYAGLEELYKKYQSQGFEILGFPCNQFGAQESGSNEEIQQFCQLNFGVTFPVMAKIEVNGKSADPVYQWLKAEAPGVLGTEFIKWNFTKFLIGRDGQVIQRYAPGDAPADLAPDIERALTAPV